MSTSFNSESLLAIDIGTTTTRAILFDAVEGSYRFLAAGTAQTTLDFPFNDVSVGVNNAIEELEAISGRTFFDLEGRLIVPPAANGSGVDAVVATLSAGKPLNVLVVGLLDDVSVESARNLAATTYARIVGTISMNDRRRVDAQVDAILRGRPDLLIIAGGTDGGATNSLLKMLAPVGLAASLMVAQERPLALFAGNPEIASQVAETFEGLLKVKTAPNVRPSLETEDLLPAQTQLRELFRQFHTRNDQSLKEVDSWAAGRMMPAASGFGRVIRLLSKIYRRGALGIDIGAGSTTVAAAAAGNLTQTVYPQLGLGSPLTNLLQFASPDKISRWLPVEISPEAVRNYVYQKVIYPASIPATTEDVLLEQALAREIGRTAMRDARRRLPPQMSAPEAGRMPPFEMIVASGSVFSRAPRPGQALMAILDAVEPAGVTTIVVDQNNLLPALGAAAEVNPALVVQVLESGGWLSGVWLNLGLVIIPTGIAAPGTPILTVRVTDSSGLEQKVTAKYGMVEAIPIPPGQKVQVYLQPLHRFDIGRGPGQAGRIPEAEAGQLGIVIDARGRPLYLSNDASKRRDQMKRWLWMLGANPDLALSALTAA